MKVNSLLFYIGWVLVTPALGQPTVKRLVVAPGAHSLARENNGNVAPFFWLGDTAWELFEGLDREEAIRYLDDRAAKKFTVIQAHLLPWEMTDQNALDEKAFLNADFDQPNERYWQHVDFILDEGAKRGLYFAVLPAWCRTYIEPDNAPLHTDSLKAYRYARFVGQRYRRYTNLIWVLGGDQRPKQLPIYRAMANGLTETYADGKPSNILMTYHPPGGTWRPPATSSGEFFHDESWLDFNMIQSGHAVDNASYQRISEDYARKPTKPTIDAEPCYEQHPIKHKYENGAFNAWHVRRRGYWSVLAGACGFTYGGNGIWQMEKPNRENLKTHFKDYWYDALNYEGAGQMQHLRQLAETYRWNTWQPDTTLLNGPPGRIDDRIQSIRSTDGKTVIHYVTNGRPIPLKPLPSGRWTYRWFDPRTGRSSSPKKVTNVTFTPPTSGENADWVLVLTR